MRFLSEEWFRERARLADRLPATPGVNVRIQHTVVGAPGGIVQYYDHVRDGRLLEWGLGVDSDADVTLVNEWSDELAVLRGEVDPMDIVMSGSLVVLGDQGKLLELVPILQSEMVTTIAVLLAAVTEE